MININKYDIKLPDGKTLSLFYNTINEVINTVNKFGYDKPITEKDITIDTELAYMKYVNEIIDNSEGEIYIRNKKHHLYKSDRGLIPVNLWCQDDFYFDGLQYIEGRYDTITKTIKPFEGEFTYPFGWTWSNPKEFIGIFGDTNKIEFVFYSFRKFGQPKLPKPKELKGVKQVFSVSYDRKSKCQIFINGNDVWVKHHDYFSPAMDEEPEDFGTSLEYRTKKYFGKIKGRNKGFVYPDSWGDIILRQEAWICIKNLLYRIKVGEFELNILSSILRQQEKYHHWDKYDLCNSDTERFWENLINECKKYIENETENN